VTKTLLILTKNKSFLFYFIITVKLLLLVTFTSQYSSDLFLPFVKIFIETDLNPWQYYLEHDLNLEAFPYHPLMLYIFSFFTYPIILFNIENSYIINLFFKLPLLLSDIAIFYIFLKLFTQHYFKIVLFYFINPIIIYSTYIHSQLDIVPMALLLYSLYLLIQRNINISASILGLAMATKTHIFLALPLLFIYIYKNFSFPKSFTYIVIASTVFLFFDLPYISDSGFWHMVITNSKQSLLFDSYYNIGELKIYLPLFAIVIILSHFLTQRKINTDLLFFYFGILFTAIIFFVSPSPAWYVWIVPFISIYFINSTKFYKSLLLYIFLNIFYLNFFIIFYSSSYADIIFMGNPVNFKIDNNLLVNISFTLLEAAVATTLFTFYKYGVKSNSIYKKTNNIVIGIGGDSGAGKTSLLNDITLLLKDRLLPLEGDSEHKWERGDGNWEKYTHLDPKANNIHTQANAIFELKNNNSIKRSEYNHNTGRFSKSKNIKPKEFISISGLHPFYLPIMRKNIDLKIYLDTDEQLRKYWKITRDTKYRRHALENVLKEMEKRTGDAKKYIYPQKQFADIIINYYPIVEVDIDNPNNHIEIGLQVTFDADIHMEDILSKINCKCEWDYNEDLKTQFINFKSEPNSNFMMHASNFISNLNEILDHNHQWQNGYKGFLQFLILLVLSEKMKGGNYEI